jgi:hypothetical protein
MENSLKYLLLLDPRREVLNLQETALSCFYGGNVLSATAVSEGESILLSKGRPEMIIADVSFLNSLTLKNLNIPIIGTIQNPHNENNLAKNPMATAVVEKPLTAQSISYLVKSLTSIPFKIHSHIPISIESLLKLQISSLDLFLKLSETNFVKVFHRGEVFQESDASQLRDKGVHALYIKSEDSKELLNLLEKVLTNPHEDEDFELILDDLILFEKIAKCLCWTPDVIISAQKSVTQAVKILSSNKNVLSVLKRRLQGPSTPYSKHVSMLAFLTCALGSSIEWIGESGQVKLVLAALIHDASIDDQFYNNIKEWDRRAKDPNDKTPETIKYRMHPFESAKLLNSVDSILPDVDQIILLHHETKDGSGFPRSMDANRIGQLPALFIIVENLMEFIDNGDNIEASITDFIVWGTSNYNSGHFKKVFNAIEEGLK